MIVGIDYGSKLAGTTVIAYDQRGLLCLDYVAKKKDADKSILAFTEKNKSEIRQIGIDAPLSLPSAFFGKGEDYFYRQCDRELRGMSPMFLGGLTARAIQLQHSVKTSFIEVYPGARMRSLNNGDWYKKDLTRATEWLTKNKTVSLKAHPLHWHAFDAILAWLITRDYLAGIASVVGIKNEGLIYF